MPNAFFRAKALWDTGDVAGGFDTLEQVLEERLGEVALAPEPRVYARQYFDRLELALYSMLASGSMVQAPWGRVFAEIWRLDPSPIWIATLLEHDFRDPLASFDFGDIEVPPPEYAFEAIVEVLAQSARKGILAPENEGLDNGRAVLALEDLDAVDDAKLGPLKGLLRAALEPAYAECPPNFWERLVDEEPADVLMRFLHHVFLDRYPPTYLIENRWRTIDQDHPPYARAATSSLDRVLASGLSPEELTDIVRYDAGFVDVDGQTWLAALAEGFRTQSLSGLPGQRPEGL